MLSFNTNVVTDNCRMHNNWFYTIGSACMSFLLWNGLIENNWDGINPYKCHPKVGIL